MKGTKGILAGLKEMEQQALNKTTSSESEGLNDPNTKSNGQKRRIVQKNFRVNEYYEKLFQSIRLKRGLTHVNILTEALDNYATAEEKELARTL